MCNEDLPSCNYVILFLGGRFIVCFMKQSCREEIQMKKSICPFGQMSDHGGVGAANVVMFLTTCNWKHGLLSSIYSLSDATINVSAA